MQKFVRRTIATVFVSIVLLLIAIWGLTPWLAQIVLKDFFEQHNADFSAESIWVNPFMARVGADNIAVNTQQGRVFKFDDFQIEIDILPVFDNKIQIAGIALNGLHMEVAQQKDGWNIAGVALPAGTETSDNESESTTPDSSWELHLPSVLISDSTINLQQLHPDTGQPFKDEIKINRLHVTRLTGKHPDWRGAATLSANINGATADLMTDFRFTKNKLTQWVDIQLLTASLSQFKHYLPTSLSQGNLNLSLIGEMVVTHKADETVVTASTKRLELDRVSMPLNRFSIESERTEANIGSFQIVLSATGDPTILFDGDLSSRKTRIATDEDRKVIAAWDSLTVNPISVRVENAAPDISIAQINVTGLTASQNSTEKLERPALATVSELILDDIQITDQQTKIEEINVTELNLNIELDEDRRLITLIELPAAERPVSDQPDTGKSEEPSADNATTTETANIEAKQPYGVILNRLSVSGGSAVEFIDRGIKPAFRQRVDINSLSVEGLNTGNPEQAMHVVLDGKTDKYSALKTDTRLWPFKDKLTIDTRTEIQEINLNPVSPYLAEALGYDIESGQLDMNITMNINQGLMDGQTKLNLRKFDLGGADKAGDSSQAGPEKGLSSAIPLNMAVSMLKNNSDNIELDIPVSGDVNSPKFGWGSFVSLLFKNALFEATAGVVVQSFVPYANVLTIAKLAGDQLLKVSVEPLIYPPGSVDPSETNAAFVDEFKRLMTDKTEMQVKACPVASLQDLEEEVTQTNLSPQLREQLTQLAISRGEAFKDAIIEDGKVKSSRILLCKPKLELTDAGQGRIEFEI